MATVRKKQSYGTLDISHISPPPKGNWPKGINVVLSFEDALKLHIGLMQILGEINSLNRATKEGKRAAVNLCIFKDIMRMTINKDKLKAK